MVAILALTNSDSSKTIHIGDNSIECTASICSLSMKLSSISVNFNVTYLVVVSAKKPKPTKPSYFVNYKKLSKETLKAWYGQICTSDYFDGK